MDTGPVPVIGWRECQDEAHGTRGTPEIVWLALGITNGATRNFFPIKSSVNGLWLGHHSW